MQSLSERRNQRQSQSRNQFLLSTMPNTARSAALRRNYAPNTTYTPAAWQGWSKVESVLAAVGRARGNQCRTEPNVKRGGVIYPAFFVGKIPNININM